MYKHTQKLLGVSAKLLANTYLAIWGGIYETLLGMRERLKKKKKIV